jgi:hypothetical protein
MDGAVMKSASASVAATTNTTTTTTATTTRLGKKASKEDKEDPQVLVCRTVTSLLLASYTTFPVLASLDVSSNVLAKCLDNFLQLQQWSAAMKYEMLLLFVLQYLGRSILTRCCFYSVC